MTVAILWPADAAIVSTLPAARLILRGKRPHASATTFDAAENAWGGAGIAQKIDCYLPYGKLLLRGKAPTTLATQHLSSTLPPSRIRIRSFLSTSKVRYSELRQVEDDEMVALICALYR